MISTKKGKQKEETKYLIPQEKYIKTPEKKSLLKKMTAGIETGNIYDYDKDNIYIQISGVKVTIPHEKIDVFLEELCEFVENI